MDLTSGSRGHGDPTEDLVAVDGDQVPDVELAGAEPAPRRRGFALEGGASRADALLLGNLVGRPAGRGHKPGNSPGT